MLPSTELAEKYLKTGRDQAVAGLITFGSFMLLLNTMIPISLMVSLELTKFFQSLGIELDDLLKEGDQRTKVFNMLIHEDLAKIDYIFADKTGTLTTNEMKFITCSVNGKVYTKDCLSGVQSPVKKGKEDEEQDSPYTLFWLNLSLCHDVVIDKKNTQDGQLKNHYQVKGIYETVLLIDLIGFLSR